MIKPNDLELYLYHVPTLSIIVIVSKFSPQFSQYLNFLTEFFLKIT